MQRKDRVEEPKHRVGEDQTYKAETRRGSPKGKGSKLG